MGAGIVRARRVLRVMTAAGACVALSGCWLAPGGGPDRNGHNEIEASIGLVTAPTLAEAWSTAGSYPVFGPPTVFGSRVFLSTDDVRTFDVSSGEMLWNHPEAVAPVVGTFVDGSDLLVVRADSAWGPIGTDRVEQATGQYVGEGPANLTSLRGATAMRVTWSGRGDPVEHVDIAVGDVADPDVATRFVTLVGSAWPSGIEATATAAHVAVSGRGLLTVDPADPTVGLGVRAYDLDDAPAWCATDSSGEYPITYRCPDWVVPVDGTTVTAPVLSDDGATVVVGTDAGSVYAVDEATGAVRWTASVGSAVTADVGIADGTVLVPTAANGLVALPLAGCGAPTCAPTWSSATAGGVAQQPVSAGGAVFVGHDGGVLAAYPTAGCGAPSCAPVWSADVGDEFDAPMAIGSGHLFVIADTVLHTFAPA